MKIRSALTPMHFLTCLSAAITMSVICGSADAQTVPGYNFSIFDVPGATATEIRAINDQGAITGLFTAGPSGGMYGAAFVAINGNLSTFFPNNFVGQQPILTVPASINAQG